MPGKDVLSNRLVIVESPAKAKTIAKYLGPGFEVKASVGHIRDLPESARDIPDEYRGQAWTRTGVDVEHSFAPLYVVGADKKATVRELKRALAGADELLLATDEDREGEAIAWHLLEVLRPKVPVQRMVFNEITKEAITAALDNTRDLDMNLVDAQETRRIVDRLYGYEVSEVLWRKIESKLSAGRVQSVAVRLIVERERERIAFTSAEYCDVRGQFLPGGFAAALVGLGDRRVATGKDFDDSGSLRTDALVLAQQEAEALAADLAAKTFAVDEVKERPGTRRPGAPFTTSTLQQEAGRKLRWSSQQTMAVAQRLYEGGFITYMRTDSTQLSKQAITAARSQVVQLFGQEYLAETVRTYANKTKNAQEAHEAIRPAGEMFRTPGQVAGELSGDTYRLYELIWQRTVASQMADAKISTTTVQFSALDAQERRARFSASGTVTIFPGFRKAYAEAVEEVRNPGDVVENADLPRLAVGDPVTPTQIAAAVHRTQPPARFNDASLVKAMEELGIGRPSTYASIILTIQKRGYVFKKGSALVPTLRGFAVTQLLERHFAPLVDYSFTSRVEDVLDAISRGEQQRVSALTRFYFGSEQDDFEGLTAFLARKDDIDPRAVSTVPIRDSDIVARVGRYGPYLLRTTDEKRANLPPEMPLDELTASVAADLIERGALEIQLGVHPDTGLAITAKDGRYGPYVQEALPEGAPAKARPRTASLLKSMSLETLTLEQALQLLSLPRTVGVDPESEEPITAQNGRFGPYLRKGTDSRSLESEEQLFTITLQEALEVYRQPKRGRGGAAAAGKPLGTDPSTGLAVELRSGRFGHYVTDGEYNATLRTADSPDTITLERAAELLADKRAAGPPKKKAAAKKTAAKKTAAKKTAAKKTAAKKTAAKKTTAKKTTAKKTAAKKTAAAKTTATKPAAKATAAKSTVAKKTAAPRKAAVAGSASPDAALVADTAPVPAATAGAPWS